MHSSASEPIVDGLDGLRALAVASVLAFHLQLSGATGGFLGVSLFFTLSGFLITQLLVREFDRTGRIAVGAFWGRRLRRLMPGALVALTAVAIASWAFDRFPSMRLRGDLFAALGNGANWRFMTASTSYADLFTTTPSPVLHFWSLAIEEQFYVLFPLLMLGLTALRRRHALGVGLGSLFVVSIVIGVLTRADDVVYYGTHTRAAELLAGALLALWFPLGGFTEGGRRSVPTVFRVLQRRWVSTVIFGTAVIGFVVLVTTVSTTDEWLYTGGLPAFSLLSVVLIIGVQTPGPIQWLAQRRIAVTIGRLSYGLYLFHWPIFLLVTSRTTPWNGWILHIARLAITGIVTGIFAICVEYPIRRRRILRSAVSSRSALPIGILVVAVCAFFVPRVSMPVLAGLDAPEEFVNFGEGTGRQHLSILVIGTEPAIARELRTSLADEYDLMIIDGTDARCPLTYGLTALCRDDAQRISEVIGRTRPDVVAIGFGALDRRAVLTRTGPLEPDDPAFFETTQAYVQQAVDMVSSVPILLIDDGEADAMRAYLDDAAMRSTEVVTLVRPGPADLRREVRRFGTVVGGTDERQRVMVVGDSTSYGVAVAIDSLAGQSINVLWAGGQNCPLVEVEEVKWWEGVEFPLARCPSIDVEWANAFDSFRPDVVVVAVSVPEQADQKYPGDPQWYEPGSEEYLRIHQEFVQRFMTMATAHRTRVVILDSPTIHGGALGGAPFAQDDRVAIWNSVIQQWASAWPRDVVVVPWQTAMAAFEPSPGSRREDGVHLAQADLDRLVDSAIMPVLRAQLQALASIE